MKRWAAPLLALLVAAPLLAQDADPFFTGRAPLVMDPSRTGFDPGARITFIHQDQWLQMPGTWRNEQLAAEWCARNYKKQVRSWFGLGAMASSDRQGEQGLGRTSASFTTAMHVRAGRHSYLSAGLGLRWANGTMGEVGGAWGSQYDGMRYDPASPSGEDWTSGHYSWAEARAGLSFTLKDREESRFRQGHDVLVAGIAADHLGHVRIHDDGPPPAEDPVRFTAYSLGMLPHAIWDHGFFAAELIANVQGPFTTGRLNLYAGKDQLDRRRQAGGQALLGFKVGVGYRWQDALLVNAALDWGKATFGIAYGWSLFGSNKMTAGRRTFEFMLQVRLAGKRQA